MNGRYSLASTPEERLAIVMVAAIGAYFTQHPQGVMPGQGFIKDYIKPFLERELMEARLNELHRPAFVLAPRELEIANQLSALVHLCNELMNKPKEHP